MTKVAFFSTHNYDKEYFNLYNKYDYQYTYLDCDLNARTIALAKDHDVICVFANNIVDRVIIDTLVELKIKLIALRCAGFNNVELEYAKHCNIAVVRVPAYSPYAVAEHAVGMLLTLNRKIHKAYTRAREGNFLLDGLLGFDLYQKNVGVIGGGKIGKAFISIMLGFGCNVFVYDPNKDPEIEASKAKYVDLDSLFANSDIISLHCPLNEQTYHIINEKSIKLMKTGVFLINTGRGGLINTNAVKDGLLSGKIGYLAMDVYEQEEHIFFHDLSANIIKDELILELMMYPNVLITAHQGFFTKEALTEIAKITTENIKHFFNDNLDALVKSSAKIV